MLYELISEFNKFTENIFYLKLYLGAAVLLFIISFMLQFFHDKYCDLYSEIIRIIHHFILFFIYCGAFAPSNYLVIVFIFSVLAFLSWTMQNNTCFLTTIEKNHCHYKKNYRFHDIAYYIDNLKLLPFKIDKLNLRYRILLLSILNIIILLRLYVYFTSN
jgi:hypothetical protein